MERIPLVLSKVVAAETTRPFRQEVQVEEENQKSLQVQVGVEVEMVSNPQNQME